MPDKYPDDIAMEMVREKVGTYFASDLVNTFFCFGR